MTTTVLRTADAWYLLCDAGAGRIETDAASTGELLADVALERGFRRADPVSTDATEVTR